MHLNLLSLLLLLSASVGAVAVARRFGFPSVLAYLAVGVVLGPHGIGSLSDSEEVEGVAEFGVVFLMFSIGLEFSLSRLKAMRTLVFGYGAAQMAATAMGTGLMTIWFYGQNWSAGLAVGLAVAMSSTAIVARMLSERFELHSRSGRQTMGVLLFQDLAVVPCLILLPALARPGGELAGALAVAGLQAAVMLTVLVWVGQRLMRRLYDEVARLHSEELFVLTTLWIVVGLALATGAAGLSAALGAFVGGMLISETAYRHQVEADVRPFRDIFMGVFFVTIGMLLDPVFVARNWAALLLAVSLLVGGKGLVVLLLTMATRTPLQTGMRTAAQLAQAGEFGLVLIELASSLRLIPTDVFQVTIAAMLISMFLAPFLIERAARLSGEVARSRWAHQTKVITDIAVGSMGLEAHVLICGYGRMGERVGQFLAAEGIPYLALDTDPQRIRTAEAPGGKVVFGSADRVEVLQAAGLSRARAVVIAYPDLHSAERALRTIRARNQKVPVIVRASDDSALGRLMKAGATEVIPEVLEGGLMLAAETLAQMGIPVEQAVARVRAVRAERYASLRDYYRGEAPADEGER